MPLYTALLEASSRVLLALMERQRPADEDVAELRRFAPEFAHEDISVHNYVVQGPLKNGASAPPLLRMINQKCRDASGANARRSRPYSVFRPSAMGL